MRNPSAAAVVVAFIVLVVGSEPARAYDDQRCTDLLLKLSATSDLKVMCAGATELDAICDPAVWGLQKPVMAKICQDASASRPATKPASSSGTMAPPGKSIAQQDEENNAAYAARVAAQRPQPQKSGSSNSGYGAPVLTQSQPPVLATANTFGSPAPRATGGAAMFSTRADSSVTIDYTRNDNDGRFTVYLTNTGNANLKCTVFVVGKYDSQSGRSHSDGNSVQTFSQSGQSFVVVGETYQFLFHSPGLFQIDRYTPSCSAV